MPIGPNKARCGAQRTDQPPGVLCKMVAGYRTDHLGVGRCFRHGGNTPTHVAAAEVELVRRECDRLGIPRDVDVGDALIELVRESAGNVEFYRTLAQELPVHPDDDDVTFDEDGDPHYVPGKAGIYGRTYHVSGIPTGEAKPHILVALYNEERDRLASYTKAALQAGVEERRVRLAEIQARELFAAVGKSLVAAGLNEEQAERFRHELANELRRTAEPASLASGPPRPASQPVPR